MLTFMTDITNVVRIYCGVRDLLMGEGMTTRKSNSNSMQKKAVDTLDTTAKQMQVN